MLILSSNKKFLAHHWIPTAHSAPRRLDQGAFGTWLVHHASSLTEVYLHLWIIHSLMSVWHPSRKWLAYFIVPRSQEKLTVHLTMNTLFTNFTVCKWTMESHAVWFIIIIIIHELVIDVAVVTSSRHADQSCARRFAIVKPTFSGHRSFSITLSQDCLGQLILHLQSPEGPKMQDWRAW